MFKKSCIKISGNKELCTSGSVDDFRNEALQGGGIAQREVKNHHMTASPSCHQLEADNIQTALFVGLHLEVQRLFVKE